MIVVEGNCRRISWLVAAVALLSISIIVLYLLIRWLVQSGFVEMPQEWHDMPETKRIMHDNALLVVLGIVALIGAMTWRLFFFDSTGLVLDSNALRFAVIPGLRTTHDIGWEHCARVEWVQGKVDPRVKTAALRCAKLLSRDSIVLMVHLSSERSVARYSGRMVNLIYQFNDWLTFTKSSNDEFMTLECVPARYCRPESVVATVNAMIQSESLRRRFCDSANMYVITDRPDGSVYLKDVESGVETPLVSNGPGHARPIGARPERVSEPDTQ